MLLDAVLARVGAPADLRGLNRWPSRSCTSRSWPSATRARAGSPTLVVFEDLSFGVEQGELVAIIGHSGCGKSTILNAVAGLAAPSAGYVFVNGRVVDRAQHLARGDLPEPQPAALEDRARQRRRSRCGRAGPTGRASRSASTACATCTWSGCDGGAENRRPAQLSGGMRQRVGIARAFAIQPEVLLMDEPFGALDALTRATVQDELLALWRDSGLTVFMITHDIDEAIYLSDRVLLMSEGPRARLAEDVRIPLPRPRDRASLLKDPRYYEVRARLVDFLHGAAQPPKRRPSRRADEHHDRQGEHDDQEEMSQAVLAAKKAKG